MLNALCIGLDGMNSGGWMRAATSMARQGFVHAIRRTWPGGCLDGWMHALHENMPPSEWLAHDQSACCVGTLWYRGRFGRSALPALLNETSAGGAIDELQLRGNFALFLRTANRCLLLNDAMGLVRIYASRDRRFYSTSWLATCAYSGAVKIDEAAAVEYVLLGASHSDQTVADGVVTLPLGKAFNLAVGRTDDRAIEYIDNDTPCPASIDVASAIIRSRLQTRCTEIVNAFPRAIRMALSGGFDSRLILAGMLERGAHPKLFVYGTEDCADVRLARQVAQCVGLPLDVVDKAAAASKKPLPEREDLVQNALFFDGLPNDGIFDTGVDRLTRLAQTEQGHIVLNGGGGEILRNYFYLPNRRWLPRDIVHAFYRGFDRRVFRDAKALTLYEERLGTAIALAARANALSRGKRLNREDVELLYPLFRCHHWMAVNNSVSTRHGYFITPLLDLALIRLACRLPLTWKNAGRLQALVIRSLHPAAAGPVSTHGFSFRTGPDTRAVVADWSIRMRPTRLRPLINATHRRLGKRSVSPLWIAHCRALFPGPWHLDPVLNLDRLPNNGALGRALAIEVAWRELFNNHGSSTIATAAAESGHDILFDKTSDAARGNRD